LPKTILAAILLTGAVLAMWLIPYDFTVTGDGRLLPEIRRNVFAALDGMIIDVPITEGQIVKAGDVVAIQRSPALSQERVRLQGEIKSADEAFRGAQAKLTALPPGATRADYLEAASEVERIGAEQQSLMNQLELLKEQMERLKITSPIDGKVVTWKVQDLLKNRPVTTGTRIMEIADPSQDWELEVELPEAKMGHVVRHLRELREKDPNAQLAVTFILATHPDPEDKLMGRVVSDAPSAEVNGEGGNTVRMRVAFDQNELRKLLDAPTEAGVAQLKKNLKVGADVKAKIHCGRAAIGYVWFHEVWEFIQSRILFRF
jgi:multidrug efflux pump subunit AcrA (membrane-fusion protein)